ncbi:MAG: N-acetylmuramoyl-L-alanine amidase CwlD [Bacillota bacterium]|nr:N-acetylmuramoyl-L-alanine amidase CwlD [Bacillota bacterium]
MEMNINFKNIKLKNIHHFKFLCYLMILALYATFGNVIEAKANIYTNGKNSANKLIMLDPGHGGVDGGAVGNSGILEKHFNLSISTKLKQQLEAKGFKVVMTRDEDKGLYENNGTIRKKKNEDLSNRCKLKESSKCNMFISIHMNMFPQTQYYGPQVWYSKNLQSKRLAHIIQKSMVEDLHDKSNRVEKPALDSYKILRCVDDIPSVIIECGFLSNPTEEAKLRDDKYQTKVAESITRSIIEFYSSNESN